MGGESCGAAESETPGVSVTGLVPLVPGILPLLPESPKPTCRFGRANRNTPHFRLGLHLQKPIVNFRGAELIARHRRP